MVENININFPKRFIFGNGTLSQLIAELETIQAKKIAILTIEPLISSLQIIIQNFKDKNVEVLIDTSIVQEPYYSDFFNVYKNVENFNPDTVIGIGGGSVLDVAKIVAAQLHNKQQLQDYVGIGLLKGRQTKLICIPTTSGTGSEVSPNAILVDDADKQKKGIISPYLVPDIVLVDPLLTINLPPAITAATGIDALTHCLEAYTNKFAHPIVDTWALQGVACIAKHIVAAVTNGKDNVAREEVARGSVYGGFCLGPVNTAGVHALSYPLGSMYNLPHGFSNALLLPYVMEYNLEANIEKHSNLALALGCINTSDTLQNAKNGVAKIKELIQQCNLPLHLREVGVQENDIEQMADDAMKIQRLLKNNPREITKQDAIDIYKAAY